MFDHIHPNFSMEKMPYGTFYNKYVTRRLGQFGEFYPDMTGMTLPVNSALHTIRNFTSLSDLDSVVPETDYPVVRNETISVYLDIHKECADKQSQPLGVGETMRFRPMQYFPQAISFFKSNLRIRRILVPSRVKALDSAMIWTDYSILKKIGLTGSFGYYRKFDIIFRTILDRIVEIGPSKHHYIWVPQGDAQYSKSLARKAAEQLWTDTVPDRGDASLYVLVHLFSYVLGQTKDLKPQIYRPEKALFAENHETPPVVKSTSLFDRLTPEILDTINLIMVKDGKCVIYNLGDIRVFSEKAGFFDKLYAHVMGLRTNWLPDDDEDGITSVSEDVSEDRDQTPSLTTPPKPEPDVKKGISTDPAQHSPHNPDVLPPKEDTPKKPVVTPEPVYTEPTTAPPPDYETHLRDDLQEKSQQLVLEARHVDKAKTLFDNHLSADFNGAPIGSYLRDDTATPLQSETLGHLTNLPDESYKHNRVKAFTQAYRENGLYKDTAKVLSSLTKEGMFIKSVDRSQTVTEMDHIEHYKVTMVDATGKSHSVAFSYPIMDKNGRIRVGGVTYTMRKQIVNVPICKISPTRVNLSSNFNKSIVERETTVRTSYSDYIGKYLESLKEADLISTGAGRYVQKDQFIPFDYSAIAQRYQKIAFGTCAMFFQYPTRLAIADDPKAVEEQETKYGTFIGMWGKARLFMDAHNAIHKVENGNATQSWESILSLLNSQFGDKVSPPPMVSEHTNLVLLSGAYPLGIVLAYQFGLKAMFEMIGLEYRFTPKGAKPVIGPNDISVRFANGTIVFSRYPLARSLIVSGLNWADLSKFTTDSMEVKATYEDIFESKNISINYLKGIRNYFDLFIDPITLETLKEMKEPTTVRELLLKANLMLSDWTANPSSDIRNHRVRGQERFAGFLYKEIATALANYRNVKTRKRGFSINPVSVFQAISRDQTTAPADIVNPLHEAKDDLFCTFSGTQGRTQASFVTKDRVMARDGMGSISEAFPDSGMVGINTYLSTNANIANTRGMFTPKVSDKDIESLSAPEILSIVNMVIPGTTQDSLKRANYASIQASHILPNHKHGSTASIRTGYDKVLPHLVSDVFATVSSGSGRVVQVNTKTHTVTVQYDDTIIPVLRKEKTQAAALDIDALRSKGQRFGILVSDKEIGNYPDSGVLSLTRTTNGIIKDKIRFSDPTKVPEVKDTLSRKYLLDDLEHHRISAIYLISLELTGLTTPGEKVSYDFSDVLTPNAGSYVLQKRTPLVQEGDVVSKGDILIYNNGFFQPAFNEKQVTFKHGEMATVILMEKSTNHEDACEVSRAFAEKFTTYPSHTRTINMTCDMEVDQLKPVGAFVEATDPLCRLLTPDVAELLRHDPTAFETSPAGLGKSEPKADYYGEIKDIKIYYSCPKEKLSESLSRIVAQYEKYVKSKYDALSVPKEHRIKNPGFVEPGSSYAGEDFNADTVVIEIMITGPLDLAPGDKMVVGAANKTIISVITEEPAKLESGEPVDITFSTKSVEARIVSAFYSGYAERNIEVATKNAIALYDKEL